MGLLDWLFKTNKKPKKKERDKWAKQAEKAKSNTQSNSKRKSASYRSDTAKQRTTQSTSSPSSSRRGSYVSSATTQRAQTQSKAAVKRQTAYDKYRARVKAEQNRRNMQALQKTTGKTYKNNQEIKPVIYTGAPEQYKEYSTVAKVLDKNADKTVYDAKTGTSKGQTLKEYYSAPEHQKEAQKEKKEVEKFINNNPFAAGFGDSYSKLVGRGVEDYKEIFKNVKGEDGKKGLNTKKYDKSTAAKVGNVLGTVSQYATVGGIGGKIASKAAVKGATKATTKALSKAGVKKFAKNRAAEIAADMPLDVAHSYKDSKGDKKEFAKEMAANVLMNVGAGSAMAGGGKLIKGAKAKAAVKRTAKQNKETSKAVKNALESLENRAKESTDDLSDLRSKLGLEKKAPEAKAPKAKKGKPVKQMTLRDKKTGEVLAKGTPRTKLEKQTMIRVAARKAGGIDNVSAKTENVVPARTEVPETKAPETRTQETKAPETPRTEVPETPRTDVGSTRAEEPTVPARAEEPTTSVRASNEKPSEAIKRIDEEQKALDTQHENGEITDKDYTDRSNALDEERAKAETDAEWEAKGKEYGTYDKANTPKQTDADTHVNKALDTAMSEKTGREGIVQDEAVRQNLKRSVLEQEVGFTRKSQKEALDAAETRVAKDPEKVQNAFNESMSATDTDVANGVALYKHYMEQGDIEAASDVIRKVSLQLTEAGRGVSAARMLMRATPAGRVKAAQALAERLTEKYAKRLKGEEIKLSDDTLKRINDAVTEEEINAANEAARVEIWNQIPADWREKFNAWRYVSMLGNPKTHIRNIIGNALFAVPREIKNIIGTGVEALADRAGLIAKGERTKALLNFAKKEDRELLDFGGKNFDANEPVLRGQNRWNDSSRPDDSAVFKNPVLERLRKLNGGVLDKEDVLFMKPAYKTAFARYMKANGLTAADMTGEVLKKAENVATDEALKATYRDASALADWLSKMKNAGPNASVGRKIGATAVESMIPFAKTPTNILRRGVEYSPVGLLHGMMKMGKAIAEKDGDELVKGIDRMASGLTGTGILGLGYYLNKNGIVTVKAETDAEGKFKKDLGEQNFSIKFGDSSYTLDWAAPMSMPFFVGASISDQTQGTDLDPEKVLNSFGDMMNPVVEMSMLQGLTNTISSFTGYGGGEVDVPGGIMGIGTNYITQAAPTFAGQLARIFDDTQRSTATTKEGTLSRTLDRTQKQLRAKIPGLSKTLEPAIDSWGREKNYGSNTERVLENFFSPGYYSKDKSTAVDKGLLELAGNLSDDEKNKIFPKGLTGYNLNFEGNDVRVNPKALTVYNKVKGKEAYNQVKELMKTDAYKKMSPTDKAKEIQKIYTDAGVWAKQETLISMGKDKFKVRTDDWSSEDDVKAAKKYSQDHDIDDIVDINKTLDEKGFSTSRNRQKNIKAMAVADSDHANKDLYRYYNVDKATQKTIKEYKKAGGSMEELGDTQQEISAAAKASGKTANELPKGLLAFAIAKAGGANRLYRMYDESTPNSRDYWRHSVNSGRGLAATGLTLKDRQKAYEASKGPSGRPNTESIVKYLNSRKDWTKEQKSYMFRQLCNWNTRDNPYGDYKAPSKPVKTKSSGNKKAGIDYSSPEAREFFNNFGANMDAERRRVGEKLYRAAKASKKGINAPYSNDKDYLPKETLQVVRSGDKRLDADALKALRGGGINAIVKAAKSLPKVEAPEDTGDIFGDGSEGSSGGGRGYYRRYGRRGYGRRGGRGGGGSSGTAAKKPEEIKTTDAKYDPSTWNPSAVSTDNGWTDAQIRKVYNALIKQGLTQQQAVSRIASLWNTRFNG